MLSYLLPTLTVASSVCLIGYVLYRARTELSFLFEDGLTRLEVDDFGLTLQRAGSPAQWIAWPEITAVRIRTSDVGPFAEDVHWEFDTATVESALVVPGSAEGIDGLLSVAADRLIGFDYEAVIGAMASTDVQVFDVWAA